MTIIGHSYSLVKSSTKCAPALTSTEGLISFATNGKVVNVYPSPIGSVLVCTGSGSLTGIESCS